MKYFLSVFFILNGLFLSAQKNDSDRFQHYLMVETVLNYTQPDFDVKKTNSQFSIESFKANSFYSPGLGINFNSAIIGNERPKRKNIFSGGFGVSYLTYRITEDLSSWEQTQSNKTTTYSYSPSSFSYIFEAIQFYSNIKYTRFIGNFFVSARAGFAHVKVLSVYEAEIYEYASTSYQNQDSNGNWVVTNSSSAQKISIPFYPGFNKSVNRQFAIYLGYKIKHFMPFISYENDKNRDYLYNKIGIGTKILL